MIQPQTLLLIPLAATVAACVPNEPQPKLSLSDAETACIAPANQFGRTPLLIPDENGTVQVGLQAEMPDDLIRCSGITANVCGPNQAKAHRNAWTGGCDENLSYLIAALALSACSSAQEAVTQSTRTTAKTVVNGVVENRFPGLNAAPITDHASSTTPPCQKY